MTADDRPTVLVVDDDEQLLELFQHFLEDQFTVRAAQNGRDALAQLDDTVDAVLLDRRMPVMSGDEVLEEIRSRGFDGPVTMVTAVEPDLDIIDLEVDDYLVKPVTDDELEALVRTLLRRTEYDEAVRRHFSLAAKVATLETTTARSELEAHDEYRDLLDRRDAWGEAARTSLSEMSADDIDALFRDLGPPHRPLGARED